MEKTVCRSTEILNIFRIHTLVELLICNVAKYIRNDKRKSLYTWESFFKALWFRF